METKLDFLTLALNAGPVKAEIVDYCSLRCILTVLPYTCKRINLELDPKSAKAINLIKPIIKKLDVENFSASQKEIFEKFKTFT